MQNTLFTKTLTFCGSFGKNLSESTVILYEYFDKCNDIKIIIISYELSDRAMYV